MKRHLPFYLRLLIGLLLVLAITLGMFNWMMHPPLGDFQLMAFFLAVTAAISGLVGAVAYTQGWLNHTPSLRITILASCALASVLTFFNVWITARLMFASEHDLQLATILLLFASGIAMLIGYFLSIAIAQRMETLKNAAQQLANGDLSTRVVVSGSDELADLSISFNRMAEKLQTSDQLQRELSTLRRELVAWATHDLQTPLAAIRVQIEALADGVVEDPQTVKRYLNTTRRQVNELSVLIDDLFQVAQMDAGGLVVEKIATDFGDLLSDTIESFSALATERGVELVCVLAGQIGMVQIDPTRIGRILNNLLSNALRHTPADGKVTISAQRKNALLLLTVADSGEGIAPQDLPFIFERFYRSEKSRNRATGGAGLGLAIVKGIVLAHGGCISVESTLGMGTTFHIQLPI
jgi:signal transduction histidine kinase